jgi:hypothetical protein
MGIVSDAKLFGPAVDWITCTASHGTAYNQFCALGAALVRGEERLGNKTRPWGIPGYFGSASGRGRFAIGDTGAIVQVSSGLAQDWYSSLLSLANHTSRLDLALTVRAEDEGINYAKRWAEALGVWDTTKQRRYEVRLERVAAKGTTLYLGDRESEVFGRLYDKHAEAPRDYPGGSWRYEVELKDRRAEQMQAEIQESGLTAERMAAIVVNRFRYWGIDVPYRVGSVGVLASAPRPRVTTDTKLAWLATCVRPSVQWLRRRVGDRAVLAALGLEDYALPSQCAKLNRWGSWN